MKIDKALVPTYLATLKAELELAVKGEGIFADHNGCAYLGEAIRAFNDGSETGLDHTVMRPQVWNAVSTLTPQILESKNLSIEAYGKILRIFWVTNLANAIEELQQLKDHEIKANRSQIANWIRWVLET